MSKMSCCGSKNWFTLQPSEGQFATGVPSVDVSTELAFPWIDCGIEDRYHAA